MASPIASCFFVFHKLFQKPEKMLDTSTPSCNVKEELDALEASLLNSNDIDLSFTSAIINASHHELVNPHHQLKEGGEEEDDDDEERILEDLEISIKAVKFLDLNEEKIMDNNLSQEAENKWDTSSLINEIGRDLSISCLIRCTMSDFGSLAMVNKSFYFLFKSGELIRLRREAGIVEKWICYSCNLLEWEGFDPNQRRWIEFPRMPMNQCFMCSDKESLAVGTELLVFGRAITCYVIYKYSLLTRKWTSEMEMNEPRCLFGSASLGEIAIIAGGSNSRGAVVNTAELYNSLTGTWVLLPKLHKARKMCAAVFMDGKFYVIGGLGKHNERLTDAEAYDLKTKTWTVIHDMYPDRDDGTGNFRNAMGSAPPLVAVVNKELYAADYETHEVKKYVKDRNLWKTLGRMPKRASSMSGWGIAFRACGERLIVLGGPSTNAGGMIEINSWIPNDQGPPVWELLVSKPSFTFVYNCAILGC